MYLTFDDGPIAELTPWVLDRLADHGAKATFFCLGRNCAFAPQVVERIREEGHALGNHTWDHPRGRRTNTWSYLRNVVKAEPLTSSRVFRPPYGSITFAQTRALRKRYSIILWDVLSGDYDVRLTGEHCAKRVLANARPGSIIVFHDSLKAEKHLRFVLPKVLEYFDNQGFKFKSIN